MGVQDWIFVSEPEVAQDLFATQGSITSGRPHIVYGNGIYGEGERYIFTRAKCNNFENVKTNYYHHYTEVLPLPITVKNGKMLVTQF